MQPELLTAIVLAVIGVCLLVAMVFHVWRIPFRLGRPAAASATAGGSEERSRRPRFDLGTVLCPILAVACFAVAINQYASYHTDKAARAERERHLAETVKVHLDREREWQSPREVARRQARLKLEAMTMKELPSWGRRWQIRHLEARDTGGRVRKITSPEDLQMLADGLSRAITHLKLEDLQIHTTPQDAPLGETLTAVLHLQGADADAEAAIAAGRTPPVARIIFATPPKGPPLVTVPTSLVTGLEWSGDDVYMMFPQGALPETIRKLHLKAVKQASGGE